MASCTFPLVSWPKVMVIFVVWVLYAEVVRIVFTNLRTMSESRKTFRFVDLVAMKQSQHIYSYSIYIANYKLIQHLPILLLLEMF